jgi:subtilisin family serine protease
LTLVVLVSLAAWSLGQTSRATPGGGLDRNPPGGSYNLANPGITPQGEYVADELLVKFRPGAPDGKADEARRAVGATVLKAFPQIGARHWRLPPGLDVARAVQVLSSNPNVEYAEPNYVVTADAFPNDASRGDLWGLHNLAQSGGQVDTDIDAPEAWDISTGTGVVVGVIDSGIDYMHEDLAANIWTNPNEIAGNSVDDDNNGYIDDVRGWDFVNQDNDPIDDYGHGTHTAGTIGAVANNGVGVAGVAWDVKVMPLKFLSAGGTGTTADAASAVLYAASFKDSAGNNVVRVTNNSWGGGKRSSTLQDAIASSGALFIASAGNSASSQVQYPAGYPIDNVISVAATDHADGLASFSSFGSSWVDLGAPGVNVLSTYRGNQYRSLNGTSMAAPHVAGVAALVLGAPAFAGYTNAQVKARIMSTVDPVAALSGTTVTGGRLNARRALNAGDLPPDGVPPSPIADLAATAAMEADSLALHWTATGDDGGGGSAYLYDIRYATTPIVTADDFAKATAAQGEPVPGSNGNPESFTLGGLASATTYHLAARVVDEVGNSSPFVAASAATATSPWATEAVDSVRAAAKQGLLLEIERLNASDRTENQEEGHWPDRKRDEENGAGE